MGVLLISSFPKKILIWRTNKFERGASGISLHILLVEPDYYSRYPPLGLLKLAALHRYKGDTVELVRGETRPLRRPDKVYVTSLFTYAWKPVHRAVRYYKKLFADVPVSVGGIYASLLPDHAAMSGADWVHKGLMDEAEGLLPDYDLVPEWDGSIMFASRGCIRRCGFCSVPKLEGRPSALKYSIKHLVYPGHARSEHCCNKKHHTKVILWDNNILGNANWRALFDELKELGLLVDFNQGLDARLVTQEVAEKISRMRMDVIRVAYDYHGIGPFVERAVKLLRGAGVSSRKIVSYTLFNYQDDPEDFFQRVRDLLNWGAVCYPMRFEPLTSLEKNRFVSPKWGREELEMVAKARRVIGYAGAFPPYEGLVNKFNHAKDFHEAFELRDKSEKKPPDFLREQDLDINGNLAGPKPRTQTRLGGGLDWRDALTLEQERSQLGE